MSEYDVAIIGYGPTGMTLAAMLSQLGRKVVILERYTGLYNMPRAACFDDEVMRMFQKLGLVEEISRGAVPQAGYDWINATGETLVSFEYVNPAPGGWAALYMMFQPHVETVLDRHCKSLPGVEVRQGVAVCGLDQSDDGVVLYATDVAGKAVTVRARYAVGADGGNSFVRRHLNAELQDYGFEENWLVCDFLMRREVPGLPTFRQICDPRQPTSIVRIGPNHHRFSFMMKSGETAEEATKPENVWARVARFITSDDAEMVRVANYVFCSKIVRQWRYGRVLLAGDAAHQMPPFLAQGMCSGMRDAHNLAWKLDLVLSGQAGESLLNTYQPEREPHVRFITEKAIELGRVQTLRDETKATERDERLLAMRRAKQAPEKLRFPGIGNALSVGGGEFFPQGRVREDARDGLLDDFVGAGWRIVANDAALLDNVSANRCKAWAALGGGAAIVSDTAREGGLEDVDGTYAQWFREHDCAAAVMRPDWYLYGTAKDGAELSALLDTLTQSLRRESEMALA